MSDSLECSCVLGLAHVHVASRLLLFTAATDGRIAFWDITQYTTPSPDMSVCAPIHWVQAHQGGVNAMATHVCDDGAFTLASVGYDGDLVAQQLRFQDGNIASLRSQRITGAHVASVTGVAFARQGSALLTVSVDQRLCQWACSDDGWQLQATQMTDVEDAAALVVIDDNTAVVCGSGMQVVCVD